MRWWVEGSRQTGAGRHVAFASPPALPPTLLHPTAASRPARTLRQLTSPASRPTRAAPLCPSACHIAAPSPLRCLSCSADPAGSGHRGDALAAPEAAGHCCPGAKRGGGRRAGAAGGTHPRRQMAGCRALLCGRSPLAQRGSYMKCRKVLQPAAANRAPLLLVPPPPPPPGRRWRALASSPWRPCSPCWR